MITEKIDNYLNEARNSNFPYFPDWRKVHKNIFNDLLDFEKKITDALDQEIGDSERENVKLSVIRKMETISDKIYSKLDDAVSNLEEAEQFLEDFEREKN